MMTSPAEAARPAVRRPIVATDARPAAGAGQDAVAAFGEAVTLLGTSDMAQILIDALPEPAFVKDAAGRFLLLNQAAADLLGVPNPAAAIGMTDGDFFPKQQAGLFAAEERQVIEGGQPLINRLQLVPGRDGTTRCLLMTKAPVRDAVGRIVGIVGTAKDATAEQTTAQSMLQTAEERYRHLIERMPVIAYTKLPGLRGEFTYTSPQFETILGFSPAEWTTLRGSQLDYLHPEDRGRVLAAVRAAAASGVFQCEFRLPTRDGRWLWFRNDAVLVRDAAGQPAYWQGVLTDITERQMAVEALRKGEARFRAVWESSADALAVCDPTGIILAVNPAYSELYGYSADEVVARHFAMLFPGAEEEMTTAYQQLFTGSAPSTCYETRLRRKDGTERFIEVTLSFVEQDGMRTATISTGRDITERKRIEAELREAEARFRTFFEEIPGLTYIYVYGGDGADLERDVLIRSHQFELLTGYPNTVWEKDHTFPEALIHPDDREGIRAYDAQVEATGEPYLAEYRIVTRDQRVVWVEEQARLIRDMDGRWRYWVGIVTDVSARKAAEAATLEALARLEASNAELEASNRELERQNNAKSDFVSVISHEFRTPLTSIQGFSELIADEADSATDVRAFARTINQNALRLGRLVQDVLDLDRMTAGPIPLTMAAIDVNDLVTVTLAAFGSPANHRLVISLDPAAPVITGDPDRLTQVVTNVVGNAIKYSPNGGSITVTTASRGDGVELTIADEGLGIPAEYREVIFAPYERISRPDHPHIEGTGLGLPISRNIVARHGGRIWVEPNEPTGSVFHILLPGSPPASAPAGDGSDED